MNQATLNHPHRLTVDELRVQAQRLLADADFDPILDGLIGWYAAEAEHLTNAPDVTVGLVDAVLGEDPDEVVYGQPAVVLAAAGICRAADRVRAYP